MAVLSTRKAVVLVCFAMLPIQDHAATAQQSQSSPVPNAPPAHQQTEASIGGFVLLSNHNVLRGNAVQRGNEIVVSRDNGTELLLRRTQVQCWADTLHDLYRFRIARRNAKDLNAYVADIRWCIRNGISDPSLLQIAKSDLQHANTLSPRQPTLSRLAQEILRQESQNQLASGSSSTNSPTNTTPTAPLATKPQPLASKIKQVDFQRFEDPRSQEIDRGTLAGFARDVQPMLLNRCSGCHRQLSQQNWKLLVPTKGSRSSARMTRENYLALSEYLNFDAALESELRLRAMDGHAGKRNTLGLRETVSSQAFDRWLQYAKPAGEALDIAKRELASYEIQKKVALTPNHKDAPSETETSDATDPAPAAIERLPQVANPFDPEIFNRRQQLR